MIQQCCVTSSDQAQLILDTTYWIHQAPNNVWPFAFVSDVQDERDARPD